jgi:hypothetical protein
MRNQKAPRPKPPNVPTIAVNVTAVAKAPKSSTDKMRARRKFEQKPSAADTRVASQISDNAMADWFKVRNFD